MSSKSRFPASRSATPSSRSRSSASGSGPEPARRRIAALRRAVDRLDLALLRALERRALAAREILALKAGAGLPARDRARERAILERLLARSAGVLSEAEIHRFLKVILTASRIGDPG